MKTAYRLILLIFVFSPSLTGQSVCDQYLNMMKKPNQASAKKRSFKMTTQIIGDPNINYTESDTLGRIHFWGRVGSLQIESFYAEGKRYSKIQSDYIKDDEWTFQEVKAPDSAANKSLDPIKNDLQNIDCQLIGEEMIKKKNYKILAYTIRKNMPKRTGVDSFLMEIKVKTWFYPSDSSVLKHEYEMTTERLSQNVKSVFEYDVPVKIQMPKNARFEEAQKIVLTQTSIEKPKSETISLETPVVVSKSATPSSQIMMDSLLFKDTTVVHSALDQTPEYKEGMLALYKYISSNIKYPEEARKAGESGTVYVSFIVEPDGKLTNIHIKKGLREDVDAEAKRIVESMSGNWKAGKTGGKEVRTTYTLPLKFELRE